MNKTVNKDVEIKLRGDLILRLPKCEHYVRLRGEDFSERIQMAVDFLQAATGVSWSDEEPLCDDLLLQNYLIQILEEKFGISIKICGNCKKHNRFNKTCDIEVHRGPHGQRAFEEKCYYPDKWIPKEITEEIPRLRSGQEK